MNYTNNYSMNNMTQLPFQMRFESALKEPLLVKCNMLSQLIQESIATNLKEIQINYMSLVDDIFGVGLHSLSTDWSLKHISRNFNPREFEAIFFFLQPEGYLFQLIRQLMNDPLNRYEFPKTLLPVKDLFIRHNLNHLLDQMPTKIAFEENVNIPPLYNNKINFSNGISLNAFEYYLFRFANHMLNNSQSAFGQQSSTYMEQLSNVNTNPQNIVYFTLLETYLNYFVPSSTQTLSLQSPSSQSSLWQSLSSTTSSFLHLSTPSHSTPSQAKASTPQTSTLFKSSILNLKPLLSGTPEQNQSQQMTHQLVHDPLGSEIAKCEIFLLIITEIWLNHAIPHSTVQRQTSPSKTYTFTPTSDHMRAVRILVKHLHYFANSCSKRGNEPINVLKVTPLDDIKQSIWSPKYMFHKKLYTFLRLSFDRWPNDTSFRLPLETWLSYIQPWRYTNPSGSTSEDLMHDTRTEVTALDHRWKQFISDNLLFYSVIFRQLIPRFSRLLDLSSSKNALMLFRLTKVFSQDTLAEWLREAENSMMTSDTSMSHLLQSSPRPSLLTPTIRHQNLGSLSTPLRHPLMELEANNFQYIPLFCPAIKPLIQQLLIEIHRALNAVSDTLAKAELSQHLAKTSNLSVIQCVYSFFQLTEDTEQSNENKRLIEEKKKTRQHLTTSAQQLHTLFEVPTLEVQDLPELLSPMSNQRFQYTDDTTDIFSPKSHELFEESNGTPKLTSYGRSQVLNRRIRPQLNLIEGNPDKQPVRTYEFYYLVQLSLWISDLINRKYGPTIEQLYQKPGFVGIFFQQLITPPIQYIRTIKSDNSYRPPERVTEQLGPRINLRFVANKVYIFYTFIFYLFVFLLKISALYLTPLLIAMYFTYLSTKSLLIHLSSH